MDAEDDRNEMDAVEALASLARCSTVRGGASGSGSPRQELVKESVAVISYPPSSQTDQELAHCVVNTSCMVTSASNSGETIRVTPSVLRSYQSNSGRKSRQNLTEAEKEAQRLRRVLANRESARLTIRRRQAMHQELVRKAANLSDENDTLKKEKERGMKEYNSLKGRNEFLKLQMANVKKAELREAQKQKKTSQIVTATSSADSSPIFLHNQPSLAPFFWPLVPSSNVIQLQYVSNADITTTSQSRDTDISSWHLRTGNPLIVLPLPWLLRFPDYGRVFHSHPDTDKGRNGSFTCHLCSNSLSSGTPFIEEKHELSSNLVPEKSNCITPTKFSQGENSNNATCVTDSQSSPKNNPEYRVCENSQNVFAATKARMRRKELMRLKNIHCHHSHTHSANC